MTRFHFAARSLRAAAFSALALLPASPAAAQFSARPVIIDLTPERGPESAIIRVRNEGADTLQFRFYVADFRQLTDGSHRFLDAGTHPRSCSDRVTLFPSGATLLPGEAQQLRVSMEPGPSTCWSLVFAQSAVGGAGVVRIGQRIGIKVYGIAPDANPEGTIVRVAVRSGRRTTAAESVRLVSAARPLDSNSTARPGITNAAAFIAEFTFRNPSETPLRVGGRIEVRSYSGQRMGRLPVAEFSVLPGHRRHITLPFSAALPPGRYLAVPVLDFGGAYLAGGQTVFRVGGGP